MAETMKLDGTRELDFDRATVELDISLGVLGCAMDQHLAAPCCFPVGGGIAHVSYHRFDLGFREPAGLLGRSRQPENVMSDGGKP